MSVARLVTCQTETSAQGPLRQTLRQTFLVRYCIGTTSQNRFPPRFWNFSTVLLYHIFHRLYCGFFIHSPTHYTIFQSILNSIGRRFSSKSSLLAGIYSMLPLSPHHPSANLGLVGPIRFQTELRSVFLVTNVIPCHDILG